MKKIIYILPVAFITFTLAIIIIKSPQGDIRNRIYEAPPITLHVFDGYEIQGAYYTAYVSFKMYDNLDENKGFTKKSRNIKNKIAACYGRCLRDKKCIAVSATKNAEEGLCSFFTSIRKIVKSPSSQSMFRFSTKPEYASYNILPGHDIFSHNIRAFPVAKADHAKICYNACAKEKACKSFSVTRDNNTYNCWLKNVFVGYDIIGGRTHDSRQGVIWGIISKH